MHTDYKAPSESATTEGASPFKPGDCLCGVPDCAGHEAVGDYIFIENHPLGRLVGRPKDEDQSK